MFLLRNPAFPVGNLEQSYRFRERDCVSYCGPCFAGDPRHLVFRVCPCNAQCAAIRPLWEEVFPLGNPLALARPDPFSFHAMRPTLIAAVQDALHLHTQFNGVMVRDVIQVNPDDDQHYEVVFHTDDIDDRSTVPDGAMSDEADDFGHQSYHPQHDGGIAEFDGVGESEDPDVMVDDYVFVSRQGQSGAGSSATETAGLAPSLPSSDAAAAAAGSAPDVGCTCVAGDTGTSAAPCSRCLQRALVRPCNIACSCWT